MLRGELPLPIFRRVLLQTKEFRLVRIILVLIRKELQVLCENKQLRGRGEGARGKGFETWSAWASGHEESSSYSVSRITMRGGPDPDAGRIFICGGVNQLGGKSGRVGLDSSQ